jgi:hypothetical protein
VQLNKKKSPTLLLKKIPNSNSVISFLLISTVLLFIVDE